ncbi:MAG: RHS repeat-associated core domain-containing protein [Fibrobacter sp.]|nr:RHS repeat-associated core domain-containing protein [Fibrobacter sp.]
MPVEFMQYPPQENTGVSGDTLFRLTIAYDGTGRRISKTRWVKAQGDAGWSRGHVTHYTGIGTEVREEFHNGTREKVNVVVNMPQGFGRYKVADASQPADDNASRTFEWYLKNHLGSTMLVYGTVVSTDPNTADIGETKAAYDYRAFGEQVELLPHDLAKVTENFTGKEHDDEIALNYFGARYLDPMLGLWISVDAARQYPNPYLYAGNNPVMRTDPDGNADNFTAQLVNGVNQNALQNFFSGLLSNFNLKAQQTFDKANETAAPYIEKTRTVARIAAVVDPDVKTRWVFTAFTVACDAIDAAATDGKSGVAKTTSIAVGTTLVGQYLPSNIFGRIGSAFLGDEASALLLDGAAKLDAAIPNAWKERAKEMGDPKNYGDLND